MNQNNENTEKKFLTQRRNLIIVSLFIIFYNSAGLEITKINFFGNVTNIGNPSLIPTVILLFFLYFLWRYYTNCRAVSGVKKFLFSCKEWGEDKSLIKAEKIMVKKYRLENIERYSPKPYISNRGKLKSTYTMQVRLPVKGHDMKHTHQIDHEIGKEVILLKLFSPFHSIMHSTTFLEYIFPYLLALAAALEIFKVGIISEIINKLG